MLMSDATCVRARLRHFARSQTDCLPGFFFRRSSSCGRCCRRGKRRGNRSLSRCGRPARAGMCTCSVQRAPKKTRCRLARSCGATLACVVACGGRHVHSLTALRACSWARGECSARSHAPAHSAWPVPLWHDRAETHPCTLSTCHGRLCRSVHVCSPHEALQATEEALWNRYLYIYIDR